MPSITIKVTNPERRALEEKAAKSGKPLEQFVADIVLKQINKNKPTEQTYAE